jgi:hypothetical protein
VIEYLSSKCKDLSSKPSTANKKIEKLGAGGSRLYPSYSGGRDQEDCGSKPVQANSSQNPISKIPITKRVGRVAQGEGPEFEPQY